ncbi:RNA methyltransferase [Tistlia consotensis]|uniref:RNA methyltransferase n=1 Tax=Tistlia consotensis TaxID=1321365 RepID=UPI001F3227EF|nr:RNA methyltransferase [Tistlia consotensis]
MAGTNRSEAANTPPAPIVILVRPQLGENIGMSARAMLNCGLTELRLVAPRDGWPNPAAVAAASGADLVLERATLFPTAAEAVADLTRVYATTARGREQVKPVVTARRAAAEARGHLAAGEKVGILFGPERTGLENDEVALADTLLTVPLNPAYSSLNLAQAVLLAGYEWYQAGETGPARFLHTGGSEPVERGRLLGFLDRLEEALDRMGFFHPPEKRPGMARNLRALFLRNELTDQEVRTLQGVLSALLGAKLGRAPRDAAGSGGGRGSGAGGRPAGLAQPDQGVDGEGADDDGTADQRLG